MASPEVRYRLGVDVGGTHTDLVLLDPASGELLVEKVSSTPKNPALGVLNGVARFVARGIAPDAIDFFAHGTTITTNALLEMRGARSACSSRRAFAPFRRCRRRPATATCSTIIMPSPSRSRRRA